ncbi:AAA family ATPase [Streptomyces sp. NPDC041068]|uniref:AAA family ATPase n=1 Tax=Streptomyces sp. NPDC041068 TaxID=3155130 RepID=UPI0033EE6D12
MEIAISDYDYGTPAERTAFKSGIAAQVKVVEGWWADERLDEQRRFTPEQPKELRSVRHLRRFLDEHALEDADDDEALVVYITGHGESRDSGHHFLLLPDSDADRVLGTAFQTAELITAVLDSRASHVLVMVDSCFSGVLRDDLAQRLKALSLERSKLSSLVVLTSANRGDTPRLGEFAAALSAVHSHCINESTGYALPHLSFQDFFAYMVHVFDAAIMADVQIIWPELGTRTQKDHQQPSPCLPNPGYKPVVPLVEASRGDVAFSRAELDTYWVSRAAGQLDHAEPGWYFTGRTALVRRIVEFLTGEEGALIVTGQAGSGKSALLARAVTLSDPGFRADATYGPFIEAIPEEFLVPEGAVDAAVLARNTDAAELTARLYVLLNDESGSASWGGDVLDALLECVLDAARHRNAPLTVVIDGIDEAKNPTRVITDLLRPLAGLYTDDEKPAVRLLLGIRSAPDGSASGSYSPRAQPSDLLSLLIRSTNAGDVVRTDGDSRQDVAGYVSALLETSFPVSDGPSAGPDTMRLRELAGAVAEDVAPSFLDARIAVQQLHARDVLPDPDDPEWRNSLRQGTELLLGQDLDAVAQQTGMRAGQLLDVLRATAFGQGAGLPWADIWPAAIRALSPELGRAPGALIRQVLESRLMGYLTTSVEDGRTVYRPIHERISETLRHAPRTFLGRETGRAAPGEQTAEAGLAHKQLALAFSVLLEGKDQPPHPYLRRHLVQHAGAGGVLNDGVIPDTFLPWETHANVRGTLGLLSEHAPDTSHLYAWTRIEPFLADAPLASRADSLVFSAFDSDGSVSAPDPDIAASGPSAGRLVPRWKDLAVPGNVLAHAPAAIHALSSFTTADGTSLIAVGDARGQVAVWDPSTGKMVGRAVKGPSGARVRALAALPGPYGEPWLAVGCEDGAWMCDPQTGAVTQLPVTDQVSALVALPGKGDAAQLAIGTTGGLIMCDPLAGTMQTIPARDPERAQSVRSLSALTVESQRTLLAVGRADTVDVLDTESLNVVITTAELGEDISALTLFGGPEGRPRLAVATGSSGRVRVWDALTGEEKRRLPIRRPATVIAPYQHPELGTLLALGGCDDGSVQLWNPGTGEEFCRFPADHTKTVTGLGVVAGRGDVPVVISGSLDRSVRVWNPEAWARRTVSARPVTGTLLAVSPAASGPAKLLSRGPGHAIRAVSADTGDTVWSTELPHSPVPGPATALATHSWPDGSVTVAAGMPDGTVGCWNGTWYLTDGWSTAQARAATFATFQDGQRVVLATGMSDGAVVYCDLATGAGLGSLHAPRADDSGPVHALAALPLTTGTILAVAAGEGVRLCRPLEDPHAELPDRIGAVNALAAYPGDRDEDPLLITGGADGVIRSWSPASPDHEAFPELSGHDGPVSALAVLQRTRAHSLVVSAGAHDSTVRLWDLNTGEEVLRLVTGAAVHSLCVLPPGNIPGTNAPVIAFGGPAGTAAVTVHLPQLGEQPITVREITG